MKGAVLITEALYMLEKTLLSEEKYGFFTSGSEVQRNFLFYGEDKFLIDLRTRCGFNDD